MSTYVCGCDPSHSPTTYYCADYPDCTYGKLFSSIDTAKKRLTSDFSRPLSGMEAYAKGVSQPPPTCGQAKPVTQSRTFGVFPESAQGRKDHPVFTGFMMYFPDAIAAVAHVSKLGNDQHNPGQPLHWAREKSTDQMDTAARHQIDHGVGTTKDTDGAYHLAKAIWRLCAELQVTIERDREGQ